MNTSTQPSNKVGAGRSILNRHELVFKRGSLMFIEGESSSEMFIVRSGKIRILKQEGESTIELAVLGPGSVLGELALLDHQPRSATAQVLEDTVVTIIDEELFARTLQQIPSWFGNLIQLVVKRLRDTMKRTSDDIIKKSIAGVIRVLLLLHEASVLKGQTQQKVQLTKVKEIVYNTIGLGGIELENVFLHLILKEMILIKKDGVGSEYVEILNVDILQLYMNYLRAHQCGTLLLGENLDDKAFDLIVVILEAGEKNGSVLEQKLVRVGVPQIEIELERKGKGRFIDLDALDALVKERLVFKQENVTESKHGHHKQTVLVYNAETLKKVLLLQIWVPIFKEDVRF